MSLGEFAGSFAQSFQATKSAMDNKKERDKMAKLQGQLLELQIKNAEKQAGQLGIQEQGRSKLFDILGGQTVGEITQGEPVVSEGGRQRPSFEFQGGKPKTLMEALSDPEGQLAAIQSGMVNPQALLPQTGKAPLSITLAERLYPGDPNKQREFIEARELNAGGGVDVLRDQVALMQQRLDLERTKREFEKDKGDDVKGGKLSTLTLNTLFKSADEAMQLQESLKGTPFEPGSPFADQAKYLAAVAAEGGGALGFDNTELRQMLADRDRLEKLYGVVFDTRLTELMESGQEITDSARKQKASISPTMDKQARANSLLLADFLEEGLHKAEIEGSPLLGEDKQKITQFIESVRGSSIERPDAIIDVAGVANMGLEELKALQGRVSELPQDVLEALNRRWKELNGE